MNKLIAKAKRGEELTEAEVVVYQDYILECDDDDACGAAYAAVMKNPVNMFAMHDAVSGKMVAVATRRALVLLYMR